MESGGRWGNVRGRRQDGGDVLKGMVIQMLERTKILITTQNQVS